MSLTLQGQSPMAVKGPPSPPGDSAHSLTKVSLLVAFPCSLHLHLPLPLTARSWSCFPPPTPPTLSQASPPPRGFKT